MISIKDTTRIEWRNTCVITPGSSFENTLLYPEIPVFNIRAIKSTARPGYWWVRVEDAHTAKFLCRIWITEAVLLDCVEADTPSVIC